MTVIQLKNVAKVNNNTSSWPISGAAFSGSKPPTPPPWTDTWFIQHSSYPLNRLVRDRAANGPWIDFQWDRWSVHSGIVSNRIKWADYFFWATSVVYVWSMSVWQYDWSITITKCQYVIMGVFGTASTALASRRLSNGCCHRQFTCCIVKTMAEWTLLSACTLHAALRSYAMKASRRKLAFVLIIRK